MAMAIIGIKESAIGDSADLFARATEIVLQTLSPRSRRVYQHTFKQWRAFCADRDLDVMALDFDSVSRFVNTSDIAKSSRQNRLSHIRKLLELLALADDTYKQAYGAVKGFLKAQAMDGDSDRPTRSQRALNRGQVRRLLDVWAGDSDLDVRNRAMLGILVYAGLRRSELVGLRRSDWNAEAQTLTIRHGKGGKRRVAVIADSTDETAHAIEALLARHDSEWLIPALTRGKSQSLVDKAASDSTVKDVVNATAKAAKVGHISPHDLRRTHITLALEAGATVADMQAQAGHARAETTLRYAQAVDAAKRRKRIQF